MRTWLSLREVKTLLGVSQPRVSQLVKAGELVAERDISGALQFDRATTERYAIDRAAKRERDSVAAEERRMLQTEARERFSRQRAREREAERERIETRDALFERAVIALEKLAKGRL